MERDIKPEQKTLIYNNNLRKQEKDLLHVLTCTQMYSVNGWTQQQQFMIQ